MHSSRAATRCDTGNARSIPFREIRTFLDGSGDLYGTTSSAALTASAPCSSWYSRAACIPKTSYIASKPTAKMGIEPFSCPIFDAAGNLLWHNHQWAYLAEARWSELTSTGGSWTENTLYSFNASDGDPYTPYADLIFDGDGNLYRTTLNCEPAMGPCSSLPRRPAETAGRRRLCIALMTRQRWDHFLRRRSLRFRRESLRRHDERWKQWQRGGVRTCQADREKGLDRKDSA